MLFLTNCVCILHISYVAQNSQAILPIYRTAVNRGRQFKMWTAVISTVNIPVASLPLRSYDCYDFI